MAFLRTEATNSLIRWAETIAFATAFGFFAFLTFRATGVIMPMIYGALMVITAIMLFVAIRRARVRGDIAVNAGYVEIDERQISYFHLGQSWSVSVNDLTSVVIDTADGTHWVIRDVFGSVVRIPNTAGGNENLFDAVSALNGVSFEQITTAMSSTSPAIFTIWRKG